MLSHNFCNKCEYRPSTNEIHDGYKQWWCSLGKYRLMKEVWGNQVLREEAPPPGCPHTFEHAVAEGESKDA